MHLVPERLLAGGDAELHAGVEEICIRLDARASAANASRSAWISSSCVPIPDR